MSRQAAAAIEALRAEGRRITTARRLVIELLARTPDHLTADDIATRIHMLHPEIHLSTVYRTLDSLSEWDLVEHIHRPHAAAFFIWPVPTCTSYATSAGGSATWPPPSSPSSRSASTR